MLFFGYHSIKNIDLYCIGLFLEQSLLFSLKFFMLFTQKYLSLQNMPWIHYSFCQRELAISYMPPSAFAAVNDLPPSFIVWTFTPVIPALIDMPALCLCLARCLFSPILPWPFQPNGDVFDHSPVSLALPDFISLPAHCTSHALALFHPKLSRSHCETLMNMYPACLSLSLPHATSFEFRRIS